MNAARTGVPEAGASERIIPPPLSAHQGIPESTRKNIPLRAVRQTREMITVSADRISSRSRDKYRE